MKNRAKVIKNTIILTVVLAFLLTGAFLVYKYISPSSEQRDLNSIFKVKQGEVALVVDDELLEEKGKKVEGQTYVPAAIAASYMDKRIYVDTVEGSLSYATKSGVIVAQADAVNFVLGKQTQKTSKPILKKLSDQYFVSLAFLAEHASCYYKEYKNPSRLIIMSNRETTYTFASLSSDTRLRTGPGKKYAYLTEVPEGGRVFVEEDIKQENEYMAVSTEDGVTGYIPTDRVAKKEKSSWKFEKTPESFEQLAMDETVCLGWHQVTNSTSSASLPSSLAQATELNVISPTWYALSDNNGNFTSLANASYVAQAHARGLKVWGLINDFKKGLQLSKVLGITTNRNKLVNSLVATAIQHDLDGINVDFEKVTKDSASAYLQFLRELTLKCHANDLVVSVDNYSPANYNAFYDLQEQGRIVDYVILMAYDEHYQGGEESGSVSSLPFVEAGVKNVLAKVPAERMVTALPFYTRLWKEVKGQKPTSEAYGMSGAESMVRANDATPAWDEATGQYYAEFKSGSATYKIWLEEETSLKKKLELVTKNQCAGVAFWKLGFERAVTWSMIKEVLKK